MFYKKEAPEKSRRKYYPSPKDIRNFVSRIRMIERFSKEDLDKINELVSKIEQEETNVKVLFTSTQEAVQYSTLYEDSTIEESITSENKANSNESELNELAQSENRHLPQPMIKEVAHPETLSFLFCYQSHDQRRLLRRYQSVAFLAQVFHNSSIKRTLTFQMYVVFVQTNVDFQAVGIIAHSKQRKEGLEEGLLILKSWNPAWTPKYVFVDPSEEMNVAINCAFPGNFYSLDRDYLHYRTTLCIDLCNSLI